MNLTLLLPEFIKKVSVIDFLYIFQIFYRHPVPEMANTAQFDLLFAV
ncbi:hypothetical protein [Methyloprofundus sedimenti]|nr:hypothetical protein [Methyloprofundus sedimenti]